MQRRKRVSQQAQQRCRTLPLSTRHTHNHNPTHSAHLTPRYRGTSLTRRRPPPRTIQ
ncbi:hypothetical protein T484DRAFT_1981307 [Baffinella frigidus]|nr:hypothetical protein T484DRAFT_1981307 [Cryptophyta sp. CCMP2293]